MADTIKLSVEFPESLVAGLWIDEATASAKMKEAVVLDLFRQKRISIRKGAELLDLSYRDFLDEMNADAKRAQAGINLVLGKPAISSQLIDNLNASIHLRTLLTDLFLIDEALK